MKLIFCLQCGDIVGLTKVTRCCKCKLSWGRYKEDGLNAVIGGRCIPLGFDNQSLAHALRNRPDSGKGAEFLAFVIPKKCPTVDVSQAANFVTPAGFSLDSSPGLKSVDVIATGVPLVSTEKENK